MKDEFVLAVAVTHDEYEVTDGSWIEVARFETREDAEQAAFALAKTYPKLVAGQTRVAVTSHRS